MGVANREDRHLWWALGAMATVVLLACIPLAGVLGGELAQPWGEFTPAAVGVLGGAIAYGLVRALPVRPRSR
jgi:hypothetical protein